MKGKVVAITGGARGIGLATAELLRAQGAQVAIGDIDPSGVPDCLPLDVTNHDSFDGFLSTVENTLGPLDVLVNNAGIMPAGPLRDEPDAMIRRVLDINIYGVITGSKLAAERMRTRGHGQVINVASLLGVHPAAGLAAYTASKFAIVGFTEAARLEYRSAGVKFTAVLPTFINTELSSGTTAPLGLTAEPGDVAAAIARVIRKPRRRVIVTRTTAVMIAADKFIPQPISDYFGRKLGMDHAFVDGIDLAARKSYDDRLGR